MDEHFTSRLSVGVRAHIELGILKIWPQALKICVRAHIEPGILAALADHSSEWKSCVSLQIIVLIVSPNSKVNIEVKNNTGHQNRKVSCFHQKVILTAYNWQKRKSRFLTCPCLEIYRVEVVGVSFFQLLFIKDYDFYKDVKFGANSWKFDIL